MICDNCGRGRVVSYKDGVYTVDCLEKGKFPIHESHLDNFSCEDFAEKPKEEVPPKENVLIILKSGRDMEFYDKEITCLNDIGEKLEDAMRLGGSINFVKFGNYQIAVKEIACWGYIGD